MRFHWFLIASALGACGGGELAGSGDDSSGFDNDAGAGVPECFSASECPVGYTCS